MKQFRIACQSITFGQEMNRNHMDEVMKTVAACGYEGIEVGFRHLDPEKADWYKDLLDANSLEMVALHIGGDFMEADSVSRQMDSLTSAIALAHILGCKNIFISGKYSPDKQPADYIAEVDNYNRIGGMLRRAGLTLSYHNHYWEFENQAAGFHTIAERTAPENMSFVPDVGWITKAGYDPVVILKEIRTRISNLHFKEFNSEGEIAELGAGIVDFRAVIRYMKGQGDMWLVAEQDRTKKTAAESVRDNFVFIRDLLGKI